MAGGTSRYFLVRRESKQAFELGPGDWFGVFGNGTANMDFSELLRDLILLGFKENWFVQPSYILWLRDVLWDFINVDEDIQLVDSVDDLDVIGSRFIPGGGTIIKHIQERYV